MTLAGGPAAKRGYLFEKLWTLSELVRMLRGETDSLRIEVPGIDGAEFVVESGAQKDFHQAKRRHPSGKWSIATLASAGVLKTIGDLLHHTTHRFVFASGSDAPELKDLCEAAASAESLDEFTCRFLAASETRAKSCQRLQDDLWNCAAIDAWMMLRRVDVRTMDDYGLETTVEAGLALLFDDAAGAQDRLSTIVDGALDRPIERDGLIRELHDAGYPLRQFPGNARHTVVQATDRYVAGVRRTLIRGSLIRRDAADDVVARLAGDGPSDCVLTGRAGMGKTACVAAIVEGLRHARVHVLAFRLDSHMSATSTKDLGHRLGLEESPALVLGAATRTDGKPAALIVDQLDAVSAMSGRGSEALDVIEDLLRETKAANVRTLVVCRSFDFKHDPQLRRLVGDEGEVDLSELSIDDVRQALSADLFKALDARQLKLLQLPQNLALFLSSDIGKLDTPSFRTTKDLFDSYWDFKRRQVGLRTPGAGDRWMEVIGTVCRQMTETQRLSVRRERLDQFPPDYLDQYVSENVLTRDGTTYGFGHESFFDYCFARTFAAEDGNLASVLRSTEQHLFRRAQVRQVLAYLRDYDFERYVRELRDLVSDNGVRVHIKDLVFALLADVDNPTDEEWGLWMDWVRPVLDAIKRNVANDDKLAQRAWELLSRATIWFGEFDDRDVIKGWLAHGSPRQADVAMEYLRWHQQSSPTRVAALLDPYAGRRGAWPDRLLRVIAWSPLHASRPLFDLFLKLVDNGTLDGHRYRGRGGDLIWERCGNLADHEPEWVAEVLAHQLRRCVVASRDALAAGLSDDAIWRDLRRYDSDAQVFKVAAESAPRAFVDHVLPAVVETAQAASRVGAPPNRDAVWSHLIAGDTFTLAESCLRALADALAVLAGGGTDMRSEIARLSSRQTYVANYLLLALYRGGEARYADEAALAFCDHPWRFHCGYLDSPYWVATETIGAAIPHCRMTNRAKLEKTILAYVSPLEQMKEGVRHRGRAAFNLLAAIPDQLRSAHANRRFGEMERKFKQAHSAPVGVVGGMVQSPVPSESAEKMNDEQWLNAIATYRSEGRYGLKGDAVELAREFGRCAAQEPERFANVSFRMPSTTNPVYFSELLRGLAGASVADAIKIQVGLWVFECARDECGSDIADILASTNAGLPDGGDGAPHGGLSRCSTRAELVPAHGPQRRATVGDPPCVPVHAREHGARIRQIQGAALASAQVGAPGCSPSRSATSVPGWSSSRRRTPPRGGGTAR